MEKTKVITWTCFHCGHQWKITVKVDEKGDLATPRSFKCPKCGSIT